VVLDKTPPECITKRFFFAHTNVVLRTLVMHLHGWRGRKHAYQQDQLMRSRLVQVLEQT